MSWARLERQIRRVAPARPLRPSGVLSNADIRDAIQNPGVAGPLVSDPTATGENVRPSCYDLTIGHIVTAGGIIRPTSQKSSHVLKPGEVATLFSQQTINLPATISGLLIPKNTPATKGLLMLNLGHVEPGWHGPVTAQVVNLNRAPFLLSLGDPIFSIVFHYLNSAADSPNESRPDLDRRLAQAHAAMLGRQSLLTLEDLKGGSTVRELAGEILKSSWPIILAVSTLAATVVGVMAASFQAQLNQLSNQVTLPRVQAPAAPVTTSATLFPNVTVTPLPTAVPTGTVAPSPAAPPQNANSSASAPTS